MDVAARPLVAADPFHEQVETIEAILREVDLSTPPAPSPSADVSRGRWRPAFAIGSLVVVAAAILSRTAF